MTQVLYSNSKSHMMFVMKTL